MQAHTIPGAAASVRLVRTASCARNASWSRTPPRANAAASKPGSPSKKNCGGLRPEQAFDRTANGLTPGPMFDPVPSRAAQFAGPVTLKTSRRTDSVWIEYSGRRRRRRLRRHDLRALDGSKPAWRSQQLRPPDQHRPRISRYRAQLAAHSNRRRCDFCGALSRSVPTCLPRFHNTSKPDASATKRHERRCLPADADRKPGWMRCREIGRGSASLRRKRRAIPGRGLDAHGAALHEGVVVLRAEARARARRPPCSRLARRHRRGPRRGARPIARTTGPRARRRRHRVGARNRARGSPVGGATQRQRHEDVQRRPGASGPVMHLTKIISARSANCRSSFGALFTPQKAARSRAFKAPFSTSVCLIWPSHSAEGCGAFSGGLPLRRQLGVLVKPSTTRSRSEIDSSRPRAMR